MIGRARFELASPSGLIGFKPRASSHCATARTFWYEAPDSNRETPYFEYGRYANSLQLRIDGAGPRGRTGKLLLLRQEGMPIPFRPANLVPGAGLEPAKSCLSSMHVFRFRHPGDRMVVSSDGIEPPTYCL